MAVKGLLERIVSLTLFSRTIETVQNAVHVYLITDLKQSSTIPNR